VNSDDAVESVLKVHHLEAESGQDARLQLHLPEHLLPIKDAQGIKDTKDKAVNQVVLKREDQDHIHNWEAALDLLSCQL
jgi:hypothetical protein